MADINITKNSKLIRVLADTARGVCTDGIAMQEANDIGKALAEDFSPQNRHMLANAISFTLTDLQQKSLTFMEPLTDMKYVDLDDKAMFMVKNSRGIRVIDMAEGATPPRSYVGQKQITVGTSTIASRPAIHIHDLRTGRVNMADLIAEMNRLFTLKKMARIEATLHGAIQKFSRPFYGTGVGINKTVLDEQLAYFRRLGPVTIVGDFAAVSMLASLTGMAMNSTITQHSNDQINELNGTGFIGMYNGCKVLCMENAYEGDSTTPLLRPDWLYIIPAGLTPDSKNLKIVTEGDVYTFEAQDINDLTFEMRSEQKFGVAFVTAHNPNLGAYFIN